MTVHDLANILSCQTAQLPDGNSRSSLILPNRTSNSIMPGTPSSGPGGGRMMFGSKMQTLERESDRHSIPETAEKPPTNFTVNRNFHELSLQRLPIEG